MTRLPASPKVAHPIQLRIRDAEDVQVNGTQRTRGIREAVAALGVIVSLGFVGYELRQNNQVARAAAIQAIADQSLEVINTWTSDEESVRLLSGVLAGATPEEFTAIENTKLRLMFLALLRIAESRQRQAELGVVNDPTIFGGAASALRSPYLRERWPTLRGSVAPDFAAIFEIEYGLQ